MRWTDDRHQVQAVQSVSRIGVDRHLMFDSPHAGLALFRTRREASTWAHEKYGYIKTRSDLRAEPHCWRVPRVVRVQIIATLDGEDGRERDGGAGLVDGVRWERGDVMKGALEGG
jgi:hypothetical protein